MKSGRMQRALTRLGAVLAAGLVSIAAFGAAFQAWAAARERAAHPPAGRLVGEAGRRLHLQCAGAGGPTLVLEAGATGVGATWAWVQRELSRSHRVCAYDRAGLGWSDAALDRRFDARESARELHAALVRAGERGPYVLVGHSMGGPLVGVYADEFPQEVLKLVLVDPSHPRQLERFPDDAVVEFERFRTMLGAASVAARFGLLRLANPLVRPARSLPQPEFSAVRLAAGSPAHLARSRQELMAWSSVMAEADRAWSRRYTPTLILSAGAMAGYGDARLLDQVHRLHDELLRGPRDRRLVIPGADHFSIIMDRRWATSTADAIRDFVADAPAASP